MKNIKTICNFLTVILVSLLAIVFTSCADEILNSVDNDIRQDGFSFHVNSKTRTATLTGCHVDATDTDFVSVPAEVEYCNRQCLVITIGRLAFSDSGVKTLQLPEGIQFIEPGAFKQCPSLRAIIISGDRLPEVEENAFDEEAYENVTLYFTSYNMMEEAVHHPVWNLFEIIGYWTQRP